MKTQSFAATAVATLLAVLAQPCPVRAEFTVHEWGTFTVLHSSNGQALRWYQPSQDQYKLPAFVHRPILNLFTKATTGDGRALARMETPVLYFYPDREVNISVHASLPSGALSEWFPDALVMDRKGIGNPGSLQWIGRLLPRDSSLAAQIPHASNEAGRHYDAARAVPDAWLFQSSLPQVAPAPATPDKPQPPVIPQIDRLIFYRGAADIGLPVNVSTADDQTFDLTGQGAQTVPSLFAVQAAPDHISWSRIDGLMPAKWEEGQNVNAKHFRFPEGIARDTAIAELRRAMTDALVTQGLTMPEAAAMIETWHDLWFGEIGTRVLAVLPQEWVAETVPLEIEPAPAHLDRVYVARLEILTKAREAGLLAILTDRSAPDDAAPRLKALGLGRFTQGALERVKEIQAWEMESRLATITAAGATTAAK